MVRAKNTPVIAGLDPAIHAIACLLAPVSLKETATGHARPTGIVLLDKVGRSCVEMKMAWMAGSSPAMTPE